MLHAATNSPAALSTIAKALYPEGSWFRRHTQIWRPYICPYHLLVAQIPRGATVLDIGCGAGLLLGLLASAGKLRLGRGFDASKIGIRTAQEMKARLGAAGDAIEFEHRDVAEPWPSGHFDVVSLIDVMHHVPPAFHREVIALACERVDKGGLLLYKDMARRPWWLAVANRAHDLLFARQWINYVALDDVRAWAVECGLREERFAAIRQLWYGHEMCCFRRK